MAQCPRDADARCYNPRNLAVYDNGDSKKYYEKQKKRCLGSNGEWKQSKQ